MSEVQVVYDLDSRTITVEVLVEQVDETIHVTAALPVLPPGDWTMIWTLIPGVGVTGQPTFNNTGGIEIMNKPHLLTVHQSMASLVSSSSLSIPFTNDCESANSATYTIQGEVDGQPFGVNFGVGNLFTAFRHDPTIAVVTDPIG